MRYIKSVKGMWDAAVSSVFKPDLTFCITHLEDIYYNIKEMAKEFFVYLVGVLFLLTFPISSFILFMLENRIKNRIKNDYIMNKRRKIKQIFPDIGE